MAGYEYWSVVIPKGAPFMAWADPDEPITDDPDEDSDSTLADDTDSTGDDTADLPDDVKDGQADAGD